MDHGSGTLRALQAVAKEKTPAESKGRWDYYKMLATIPLTYSLLALAAIANDTNGSIAQ